MKFVYEAVVTRSGRFLEARFPDLDIITQGDDETDVAYMAQDLLETWLVVALQEGRALPKATFGHATAPGGYRMVVAVECSATTPQEETMTVGEAADVLCVTPGRVRAMIRDGVLRAHKVGGVHAVETQSVMDRFNNPRRAGRPREETRAGAVRGAEA